MEPQSAIDYEERGASAVIAVLLEIGQVLGAFRERFVIIGGAVPWLLLPNAQPAHIGTLDVDLSLDPSALGDAEYVGLVEALEASGYERGEKIGLKPFQLRRLVPAADGATIPVIVDLLMPREAKFNRNKPPILANFAVLKADGATIAMQDNVAHQLEGVMPDGRKNRVELRVASIASFLVMKGYALAGRDKRKDAYDIYFSIRNYVGGHAALAHDCKVLIADPVALKGYQNIAEKFRNPDDFGPATVREFLAESQGLGDMTPVQVQTDAFGQVNAWIRSMRL